MTFICSVLVSLLPLAASAASQPATTQAGKTWKDVPSILAAIPAQVYPRPGAKWTDTNTDLANQWLAHNIVSDGFKSDVVVAYTKAGAGKAAPQIIARLENVRIKFGTLRSCEIEMSCDASEAAVIAKLARGDPIICDGTIKSLELRRDRDSAAPRFTAVLRVVDCTLETRRR